MKENDRPVNKSIKFVQLGFQMAAVIGGTTWVGVKVDKWLGLVTPWFTVFLGLFGVFAALYQVFKEINKEP